MPWPPNYGGAIDVFYKIRSLHALGIKIILHCFEYGRGQQTALNQYCEKVYYYERKSLPRSFFGLIPYIVASRRNKVLVERLANDSWPILLEGFHTCEPLQHPQLRRKRKLARMHNIEWIYYNRLAKQEKNLLYKTYYLSESFRLKRYEHVLKNADVILAINQNDTKYFGHFSTCHTLYPFHTNESVDSLFGKGDFALYHGNLSVNENEQAVFALLEKVIAKTPNTRFVIAGKDPSSSLSQKVAEYSNVRLVANPSQSALEELIKNAHLHLLATFQNTGVKLKLLHALFSGRHCLVNKAMLDGLELNDTCITEDNLDKWPSLIEQVFKKEFDITEKKKREELFSLHFDNLQNAQKLVALLFDDKKE